MSDRHRQSVPFPRLTTTGRVTQARVVRSEWTKLHLAPLDALVALRRRRC